MAVPERLHSGFLFELRTMEVVLPTGATRRANLQSKCHHQQTNTQFLQAGCPSCRPTNGIRALTDVYKLLLLSLLLLLSVKSVMFFVEVARPPLSMIR